MQNKYKVLDFSTLNKIFNVKNSSRILKEEEESTASNVDLSQIDQADIPKTINLTRKLTVEDIVQRINSIRAGRSLFNKDIRLQLELYFDDLSEDEKLSLYAFLTGLNQIVTGEVSGKAATEPEDVSVSVKKQKINTGKKMQLPVSALGDE